MKLRYIIQLSFISIALFFAVFWWFENRYIHSINVSFDNLQTSTIPALTSLLELSSSARRASIKAVEYSMRGQNKDREKAIEALNDVSSHFHKLTESKTLVQDSSELASIEEKVNNFLNLVENYLFISSGPSINQLFEEQEKVQGARRTLIHSFKPIHFSLNDSQKLIASKAQSEARKISVKLLEFSLRGNPKDKEKAVASINALMESFQQFTTSVDVKVIRLGDVIKATEDYLSVVDDFLQLSSQRKHPIDYIYNQEEKIHTARKSVIQSLYPLIESQYEFLKKTAIKTNNSIENADTIQKASSFVFIILAAILGFLLSKMIIKPILELNKATQQIGEGKFDTNIRVNTKNEIGELAQAFNEMTTNLQRSNDRIEYMAFYDELTGLANRRLMINRLEQALVSGIRHGHRGALMVMDLDRFKNINDSLGHAAGDLLLSQVADRLESSVREEDTIARLGGDEFVILLPFVEKDGDDILAPVAHIAENIREVLSKPYQVERNLYNATPSIGVVLFPHLDDTAENLLKRADAAMYRSKRDGGNRVSFYEKAIQQAADERLHLEKDLQLALENQELYLVYQPQCDVSGNIIGVETLVRWNHPERGMIPPPKFIEIAEETGMIVNLGNWILERACGDMASLLQSGNLDNLTGFSVNVSAHQFRDQLFYETVLRIVEKYKIPSGMLKLELTESALLHDFDIAIDRMQKLRNEAIRFSLDDFGTGYSSLSYLSRLPLDELKIDRSFLLDAENNTQAWLIIGAIIDVAQALNLQVVAEGVEQQSQIEKLNTIDCNVFQGYKFFKPLPFDRFKALLLSQNNKNSGMVS